MAALINDLGGASGFGEQFLAPNDDGSTGFIDLTSIFENGLNFFGQVFTGLYVNNNGNVTFLNPLSTYTPQAITGQSNFGPIIAAYFADIDTRGTPGNRTAGGNSQGTNLVYYDLDTERGIFTVTWDDVGYFSAKTNRLNAFQLQLIRVGDSDFDIVFRYEDINFTTGDVSGGVDGLGGVVARAGYTSGDGQNFFEMPQSGNQAQMLDLENTSNVGEAGIYQFQVRQGSPTINISVSDARIVEGNTDGNAMLAFDVTLSAPSDEVVSVDYSTAAGTATADDFASQAGTLTFASGQVRQTVFVRVTGDTRAEVDETVILNLRNARGGEITDAQGIGTIVNDDGLTVTDVSILEGTGSTPTRARFVVKLLSPSNEPVSVSYNFEDGTATVGSGDYTPPVSGRLVFAAGETEKEVFVDVRADAEGEADETVILQLFDAVGTQLAKSRGQLTIRNDDGFVVNDVTITEGTGNQPSIMRFNVDLLSAVSTETRVSYRIEGLTATAGQDYTDTTGTLTFAAGTTRQTVDIAITADSAVETAESLTIRLFEAQGAVVIDDTGTGTIIDDDGFSIADVRVVEGSANAPRSAQFTVSLGSAPTSTVTVDYVVSPGTATAGQDYTAQTGTLTFAAGIRSQTITIPIIGDSVSEDNETFFVTLSNPTGTGIVREQATGTIINDDGVSVSNAQAVNEGNGDSQPALARFTINLSAPTDRVVTVAYTTADGTAEAGEDYIAQSGTVQIAAGATSATVDVQIIGDRVFEANETFLLSLTEVDGSAIVDGDATGFIQNDDQQPPPSLSVFDVRQTESDTGTQFRFLVGLDRAATSSFSVSYATRDGSAVSGSDYTTTSGFLNFAAGDRVKEIFVDVTGDTILESDEQFFIDLSLAAGSVNIADQSAVGEILNDDLEIRINDITVSEGSGGQSVAVFTLSLTGAESAVLPASVFFHTFDLTADSTDFTATRGTVNFEPGQTQQTITIELNPDRVYERDEQFSVVLADAINARIVDDTGIATILNDDAPRRPVIQSSTTDTGISNSDRITNDRTQTLTISASAGTTVQVLDNGQLLGTATETSAGRFGFTTADLSNGSHSFTAISLPADSGPSSAASAAFVVRVDTVAPNRATITSLTDDTGLSSTDRITSDNTLTLSISAEAGSRVTVRDGNTVLGDATEVSTGRFSFTTAVLSEGAHSLTAQATDVAGNIGLRSAIQNVTVDTLAPTAPVVNEISQDSGVVGDLVTSDNVLTLVLNASERGELTVFSQSVSIGTASYEGLVDGQHRYTFATQTLADGTYNFTAQLRDAAGNESDLSQVRSVTVDTAAPNRTAAVLMPDGVTLRISFDSQLAGNQPSSGQFSVQAGSATVVITSVAVQGSDVILTLRDRVAAGQTLTVNYTDATTGDDLSAIQDLAGNDAQSFNNESVRNDVIADEGVTRRGTSGADSLTGTNMNDTLLGLEGNDTLIGLDGNDRLDGGTGDDSMTGGSGDDVYIVDSTSDIVSEAANGGNDTVRSSVSSSLTVNVENLILTGTDNLQGTGNTLNNALTGNDGKNTLNGAAGNDTLNGGAGDDSLTGGIGNDNLNGGTGNDNLNGGAGNDSMVGGLGNDTYFVDSSSDTIIEGANGGIDTVRSTINWSLGSQLENLTLDGALDINGTGNTLANRITGNVGDNLLSGLTGNDFLSGLAGNDTLIGGQGSDFLLGGADADTYVYSASSESNGISTRDTIIDFISGEDKLDLSALSNTVLMFIGTDAFSATDATNQVRFQDGTVFVSTDADTDAEMAINLIGVPELLNTDLVL